MPDLETNSLAFSCKPEGAAFSLVALPTGCPQLTDGRVGIHYRQAGRKFKLGFLPRNMSWANSTLSGPERVISNQGPMLQVRLEGYSPDRGLRYRVEFALGKQLPLFLWRVTLENLGNQPIYIDRITMMEAPAGSLRLSSEPAGDLAFFANGWQSWSYTGAFGHGDKQPCPGRGLGPFRVPAVSNPGTPTPGRPGHYASDFFGILGDRKHRTGLLAGFLSQRQHFGSLEAWTKKGGALHLWANGDGARLDPGQSIQTDWAVISFVNLDEADPLGNFVEAVARQYHIEKIAETPVGWCSWYQYFNKVTADDIRKNLDVIASNQSRLGLQLVQIDDGFETAIGDWSTFKPTFPNGVSPLASEIRGRGLTPGLWLAPFLANMRSRLVRENPDFILRNALGLPVNAGATMESLFNTALDLTHPGAMEYASSLIRTAVQDWGFPYLKLDFLYAGALPGRHKDPTKTRAQILRAALETLRLAAGPDTYLVACGAPLGSVLGLFQACRIGDDVSPGWKPSMPRHVSRSLPIKFENEANFPSTRNALQNILTRAPLHKRWWINDPDCLMIRPDSDLTLAEIQTLASAIALTGGAMLLSDEMQGLPSERLSIAQSLLPIIGKRPRLLDWFDASRPTRLRLDMDGPAGPWHILGLFNWSDDPEGRLLQTADYDLPAGEYWVRSFWDDKVYHLGPSDLTRINLLPHGSAVLAVHPLKVREPQYLGSSLHISQGMEVSGWQVRQRELRLRLTLPRKTRGVVELALPLTPLHAWQGGQPITWEPGKEGAFRFPLDFNGTTLVEVDW
jgi:alpha-galactosidase